MGGATHELALCFRLDSLVRRLSPLDLVILAEFLWREIGYCLGHSIGIDAWSYNSAEPLARVKARNSKVYSTNDDRFRILIADYGMLRSQEIEIEELLDTGSPRNVDELWLATTLHERRDQPPLTLSGERRTCD